MQGRDKGLEFEKQIGKTVQITSQSSSREGGFYCERCDVLVKDSHSWMDHLNGAKHNSLHGMSMKVEKVGVDAVRRKLESLKRKPEVTTASLEDIAKRLKKREHDEEEKTRQRKDEKKLKSKTVERSEREHE